MPIAWYFNPFIPTFVAKMSLPKRSAPYWCNPPYFNFLTFGHSGAQSWAPECPNTKKLKMVGYISTALNTLKCNHLTSLGLKGLISSYKALCGGSYIVLHLKTWLHNTQCTVTVLIRISFLYILQEYKDCTPLGISGHCEGSTLWVKKHATLYTLS